MGKAAGTQVFLAALFRTAENKNNLKTINQGAASEQRRDSEQKGDAHQVLSVPPRRSVCSKVWGSQGQKEFPRMLRVPVVRQGCVVWLFCCIFPIYLTSITFIVCRGRKRERRRESPTFIL